MDIATLRMEPFAFDVAPLGPMTLDASRVKFLDWVERQLAKPRLDGNRFVTALISEFIEFPGEKPSAKAIANLPPERLNAVARAIREVSGNYFSSKGNVGDVDAPLPEPETETEKVVVDADGQDGEKAEADWLLEELTAYYERHTAGFKGIFKALEAASGVSARLALAQKSAAFFPELSPTWKLMEKIQHQDQWLRKMTLPALDQIAGITAASAAMRAITNPLDGILRQWNQIDSLTRITGLGNIGAFAEVSRITAGLPDLTAVGLAHRQLGLTRLSAIERVIGETSETFDRISRLTAAAAGLAEGDSAYAAVSRMALEGAIPAGISAAVLGHFEDIPNDEAPFFGAVLRRAQTLDMPPEMDHFLDLTHRLLDQVQSEKKGGQEAKWVGRIALLIAIITLFMEFHSKASDQSEAHLKKIEAHSAAIEDYQRRLIEEAAAANEAQRLRKNLRYVPQRTPLRDGPNGQIVRYVFPDQTIQVLEVQGDWVFVEVFAYETEAKTQGWVYRGNLRLFPAT